MIEDGFFEIRGILPEKAFWTNDDVTEFGKLKASGPGALRTNSCNLIDGHAVGRMKRD
jgi:hypothetical protein